MKVYQVYIETESQGAIRSAFVWDPVVDRQEFLSLQLI